MIGKYLLLAVAVVVVPVLIHGSSSAQMYKWGDENGNVHFSNDVKTIPERYRPNVEATESERLEFDQTARSLPGLRAYVGNLEPEGFREIKWGAELPSSETLEYIEEDPRHEGIKTYIKVGDDLTIGGATLKRVEYRFWRSRFCGVRIVTEGYSHFAALREAAFERFSEGYKPNRFIERYFWIGNRTNITLDYDELTGLSGLLMSSVLMIREMEEADKHKAIEEAIKHL